MEVSTEVWEAVAYQRHGHDGTLCQPTFTLLTNVILLTVITNIQINTQQRHLAHDDA